jgi:GNAT superfamily N-acetyltransferase
MQYAIRHYRREDRPSVRRISCETAFLEADRHRIFSDEEILADALTLYFTDHEPESCFVADSAGQVAGYIIGARDVRKMGKVVDSKILLPLLVKAWRRKVFFNRANLRFFMYVLRSAVRGEFLIPDFATDFPATLHINLDRSYRAQGLGRTLIDRYLDYLKENGVHGVHFGTMSDQAMRFFLRMGFQKLYEGKRTYLQPYSDIGREVDFCVFGRRL